MWWSREQPFRLQNECRDVSSCSLTLRSILDSQPAHITKVSDFSPDSRKDHQHPFIDGIDQYDQLPFGLLFDGFANPRGWAFLLALVHDGSKRRIDVIRPAPFAS